MLSYKEFTESKLTKRAGMVKLADPPSARMSATAPGTYSSSQAGSSDSVVEPAVSTASLSVNKNRNLNAPVKAEERSPYIAYEPVYKYTNNSAAEGGSRIMQIKGYKPKSGLLEGSQWLEMLPDPSAYNKDSTVTIQIAGAGDGPDRGIVNYLFPTAENAARFRYSDIDQINAYIKACQEAGVTNFNIIGHSRGGDTADQIGYALQQQGLNPTISLIDPVSSNILKRNKTVQSDGASVYVPKNKNDFNWSDFLYGLPGNLVARIGGRFTPNENTVEYSGDHCYDEFGTVARDIRRRQAMAAAKAAAEAAAKADNIMQQNR